MPVFYLCSVLYLWVCVCSGIVLASPIDSLRSTHVFREVSPNLSGRKDLARGNRMNQDYIHKIVTEIWQRNVDQLITLLHESSNQRSLSYGQLFIESEKSIVASTHQTNGATVRSSLPVTQREGSSSTFLLVKDAELIALKIKEYSTVSLTSKRISPTQTHVCSQSSLLKDALNTELITVTVASSDEPVVTSPPGAVPSVSSSVAPTRRINGPSVAVTGAPSAVPSVSPSIAVTVPPRAVPSSSPIAIAVTVAPSAVPSSSPIAIAVTVSPRAVPISSPIAFAVTGAPTAVPSSSPIAIAVTGAPSAVSSVSPSVAVTVPPRAVPSASPIAVAVTVPPRAVPSSSPIAIAVTGAPSAVPSSSPIAFAVTVSPRAAPSSSPIAVAVTGAPSAIPSLSPSVVVTVPPRAVPSSSPIAVAVTDRKSVV